MLWLNTRDNQGARCLLGPVRDGIAWDEWWDPKAPKPAEVAPVVKYPILLNVRGPPPGRSGDGPMISRLSS